MPHKAVEGIRAQVAHVTTISTSIVETHHKHFRKRDISSDARG
jgi:hypothetical protein